MKSSWRGFQVGCALILAGSLIAHLTQTSGGITVKDVRFSGTGGKTLSALLYLPPDATPETKAPGILAVHGYINSREVQSGFAIEYARRGYVVLALDQTGHGYSEPPAFSDGFGGPAALKYLRSLDMVDTKNIGLEGHSMGGWAILAAAAAQPDGYRAMVLEGSSTGPPFAADGSSTWPRNVAVVFSQFDEFAQLMWGIERANQVSQSAKLQALFGTETEVQAGQIYGDISSGTARVLQQPPVTHPGDHISHAAIGHSLDWFAHTLSGGRHLPSSDQIWLRKELGTLLALIGFVVLVLGSFQLLQQNQRFQQLKATPTTAAYEQRTVKWWVLAIVTAVTPVATFYLFFGWAEAWFPPSNWLPQGITNQIVFWALANAGIATLIGLAGNRQASAPKPPFTAQMLIALACVSMAYVAVLFADYFFLIDFRFWFVGIKALSPLQFEIALVYLVPLTIYFLLALRGLHLGLSVAGDSRFAAYASNAFILMGGFLIFLLAQYATLFTSGALLTPSEPLNTIVMIQFAPLLLIVAIISTFTYRRTASYIPGALINGLFVTWYIVAGQATQYPVG
jgi:pimeloyl-ACP methyl ester carboxylesterase